MATDSNNFHPVSWEELAEHLNQRALSLHSLLLTIQSGFDRENRNLAIFNLGRRAAQEVERATVWLLEGNELIAWTVRNLYEIHLILEKVLQSEESLNQWLSQFFKDDLEIIEGFQTIRDSYPLAVNELQDRQQEAIRQTCDRLGIEMSRAWRVSDLARSVGREGEYRMIYKFLSKYVHPTSWMINANSDRTNSDFYRNLLVGPVQIFSSRIQNDIEAAFDLKGRIQPTGHRSVRWKASSYDKYQIAELRQMQSDLLRELDVHVRRWSANSAPNPTVEDIEILKYFALLNYVVQRFDWKSWPQWQAHAARLYGAAKALWHSQHPDYGAVFDPTDLEILQSLKEDLGIEVFDTEFARGDGLDWKEAVQLALSVPE